MARHLSTNVSSIRFIVHSRSTICPRWVRPSVRPFRPPIRPSNTDEIISLFFPSLFCVCACVCVCNNWWLIFLLLFLPLRERAILVVCVCTHISTWCETTTTFPLSLSHSLGFGGRMKKKKQKRRRRKRAGRGGGVVVVFVIALRNTLSCQGQRRTSAYVQGDDVLLRATAHKSRPVRPLFDWPFLKTKNKVDEL